MNKKENVINLLEGKEYSYTPSGFWLHFPNDVIASGVDSQVKAHLEFLEGTDVDILKIMNENEFRSKEKIASIEDWDKINPLSNDHILFKNQEEINSQVVNLVGEEVFTLGTVHGIMASLSHSSGLSYSVFPQVFIDALKIDERRVVKAIEATYKNVSRMLEVTEASGVDGIYYALLGAEENRLPAEVFEKYIAPYDRKLLEQAKTYKFLHVCKERTDLNRIKDYNFDVLNWAVHENEIGLVKGQELFPNKIILGGLDDRSGVLVDGTKEEIEEYVNNIKRTSETKRFILGADCTLPTEINYERIFTAVKTVR